MSEPVSNAEIEDVLTSIRRLVSGDAGKISKSAADDTTSPAKAAKLILTQDFRVSETRNKVTPDSAKPEKPMEFHHAAGQANSANKAKVGDAASLESTIAELEAAIAQQEGEWEPDGSGFEEDPDAEEILSAPVVSASKRTSGQKTAKAEAETSAPESAANGLVEDVEIVKTSTDSGIFDMASKDVEDAEIVDEDDFAGEPEDLLAGDDSEIDEETLREMISDIVRQELQGALGERITRNVRKLVRREINRVLASQDFE